MTEADARKQADALAAKHNKPVAVVPLTRLQFIPIFAAALNDSERGKVYICYPANQGPNT